MLIGFRALQGIGAGGLFTLAMAIVGELVPPRERGQYQGYIQAMFALASIAGPLIGGTIIDHVSWRWVFYVNLPIGAIALLATGLTLSNPLAKNRQRPVHVDYLGAVLLATDVTLLLFLLMWGGSVYPWTSPVILGLAAAVAALTASFIAHAQRTPEAVLSLALLRNPVLVISSATLFLSTGAFFAAIVFLPLFLQLVRGDTAGTSGLLLLPMMFGTTLSAAASGRVISWTGRYKYFPVVGLALMAITLYLFAGMSTSTDPLYTAVLMAVFGVGFGMVGDVLILAVQNAVAQQDLGSATGTANLFRALGGSVGLALYGSILGRAQGIANALPSVFMTAAVLAGCGFIVVLFLPERPLRSQLTPNPQEK